MFAIQDQVVLTRAYQRHVMKADVNDRCRLCRTQLETVQHITGGCTVLAPKDYLARHDNVGKVVHQALARDLGLLPEETPYYKCRPPQVLQKGQLRLLWDSVIVTDRSVEANRPDICVLDVARRRATIVDIAVPLDENLVATHAEKRRKYQPLAVELKDIYQLERVDIIPVVVSVNGLVTKDWSRLSTQLPLRPWHLRQMQKAAILGTAYILRKVLSLQ